MLFCLQANSKLVDENSGFIDTLTKGIELMHHKILKYNNNKYSEIQ